MNKTSRSKEPAAVPRNHGKDWTIGELMRLNKKAYSGRSTIRIAQDLGRTVAAIRSRAAQSNISLKPRDSTN